MTSGDDERERDGWGLQPLAGAATELTGLLALSREYHERRIEKLTKLGLMNCENARQLVGSLQMTTLTRWIPKDLTVTEYLACTTEESEREAWQRTELCLQCSERGGACADAQQRVGHGPVWTDSGFVWKWCRRWRVFLIDEKMRAAGFPAKLLIRSFATYRAETGDLSKALAKTLKWVEKYERCARDGRGLLLCGGVGVGKTHLAVAACRVLFEQRRIESLRFWDMEYLLEVLRQHDDRSVTARDAAMEADLLVLDDLNTDHGISEWARKQLGMIINHRWSNNLPLIVTTNDELGRYETLLGARTVSRLRDMLMPVVWSGRDYRSPSEPTAAT